MQTYEKRLCIVADLTENKTPLTHTGIVLYFLVLSFSVVLKKSIDLEKEQIYLSNFEINWIISNI